MVTSGGMECIALACAAMLEPGDAIAVEGPTYLGALMAFRGAEADVHEIPMDEDGLVVDALAERLEDGLRPKLLYVIPEYQNPTGRTLPLERREALVELCRRHGVLILEDVAYRELAWGAEPLPTLWSLAPDVVVQAGTFSKVFFPGVRLGWAAGPEEVVRAARGRQGQHGPVRRARSASGWSRSTAAAGTSSASSRAPASSTRRTGARSTARCARTCPTASPGPSPPAASSPGSQLPAGLDAMELRDAAIDAGVAYVPGAPFYASDRAPTSCGSPSARSARTTWPRRAGGSRP